MRAASPWTKVWGQTYLSTLLRYLPRRYECHWMTLDLSVDPRCREMSSMGVGFPSGSPYSSQTIWPPSLKRLGGQTHRLDKGLKPTLYIEAPNPRQGTFLH